MHRIRTKNSEKLDDKTISKVISLLDREDPITKKEACEILNISYNTNRLSKIINAWKEEQEYKKERRKQLKNKPVSIEEEKEIVASKLQGDSIYQIAEITFRSVNIVKNVLKKYNLPEKQKTDYFHPQLLEDDSIKEHYDENDLVYSARYDCPASIIKRIQDNELGPVYKIWIHGENCRFALQPFYELADLTKVQKELKVKVVDLSKEDINSLLYESWLKANKKGKHNDE